MSALSNYTITSKEDLRRFPFRQYLLPTEKIIVQACRMINAKAKEYERSLIKEDQHLDGMNLQVKQRTRQVVEESSAKLREILKGDISREDISTLSIRVSEIVEEIQRSFMGHLWHIEDYFRQVHDLGKQIEDNRFLQRMTPKEFRELVEMEVSSWELERIVLEHGRMHSLLEVRSPTLDRNVMNLTLGAFRQARKVRDEELVEKFAELGVDGKKKFVPDPDKVIRRYEDIVKKLLYPITIAHCVTSSIHLWPHSIAGELCESRERLMDEVQLMAIDFLPRGFYLRYAEEGRIQPVSSPEILQNRAEVGELLKRKAGLVVSTLVYDIRGSTFMSLKLRDAGKQREILSRFHAIIADIIRDFGGFLIKETGDGGIAWFGDNSEELYRRCYKEVYVAEKQKLRHLIATGREYPVIKSRSSGERALKCAAEIVKAAEAFVRENYVYYRDWFGDVVEKEILYDGIRYELLPPEFKALFRVGVGIASGGDRDIWVGLNSYGDLDIIGSLVNEAHLFSSARDPMGSVIILDHLTLANALLNAERFEIEVGNSNREDWNEHSVLEMVAQVMHKRLGERCYLFGPPDLRVERGGFFHMNEQDKRKALVIGSVPDEVALDIDGRIHVPGGEEIKVLYSATPLEELEEGV